MLMMHAGGQVVELEELKKIEVPFRTKTYMPVDHFGLVETLREKANELFIPAGFRENQLQVGLARNGQQLFGHLDFINGSKDMSMAIGFRNSYDKTLPVGIAVGSTVFVCDNLCLSGEIKIMRKHTYRVWDDVRKFVGETLNGAPDEYEQVIKDAAEMAQEEISNDLAFEMLGKLYGRDILTVTQLVVAKKEWLHPSHAEFLPRTRWSLFNAVTESLKATHPKLAMQNHTQAYKMLTA